MAQALYNDKTNTINDICRTLNISRATLYRYLKTPEGRVDSTAQRPHHQPRE
jgi:predicted transcriptional regulator YheO